MSSPTSSSSGSSANELDAVALLEHDGSGDELLVWAFPAVSKPMKEVLLRRAGLAEVAAAAGGAGATHEDDKDNGGGGGTGACEFRFSRFRQRWVYQLTFSSRAVGDGSIPATCLCVLSTVFNPEKHEQLLRTLRARFEKAQRDPVAIMSAYLKVVTTKKCDDFDSEAFDDRRALIASVRPLFAALGAEAIAVWVAVLLKKRVFVLGGSVREAQAVVRAAPLLGAWHRLDWSMLRPYVTLSSEFELRDLESTGVYVAGFTDAQAANRTDLYDVLVDLPSRTVRVAPHSKKDFQLAKFHRDLGAQFAAAAADEEQTDQALIKLIALKTKELIANVRKLAEEEDEGRLTMETLQSKNLPANMDRFLFNVALAEKI